MIEAKRKLGLLLEDRIILGVFFDSFGSGLKLNLLIKFEETQFKSRLNLIFLPRYIVFLATNQSQFDTL